MNKQFLSKIKPFIINILLSTIIFFIASIVNNIYPFGPNSLAKYDAYHQYMPMLFNYITKLKSGLLSSYTFLNGLGNPTIFNYLYYLSSPINVVSFIFKSPDIMFTSVIYIKIIIGTILMSILVKKKTNSNILSTICSITYIFSGWFLAYYYSIMWLDSFIFFPIFQYGLDNLIDNNKVITYILSLAYIMISNFYMAWIICCYTLIYYLIKLFTKKESYYNKIKNFNIILLSSLVTFLLAFAYIYITYDSFLTMGILINNISNNTSTITISNLLKSFYSGNYIVNLDTFGETFPNISISTLFLISFIYYFFNSKITIKEKIISLFAIILSIFVFHNHYINYLLNCFHVPAGYNFRYSFIFTFYIITLFIKNYQTFEQKIEFKKIIPIIISLLLILIYLFKNNNIVLIQFVYNLTFLLSYTIFFLLYKNNKLYKSLIIILVVFESIISFSFATKSQNYPYISSYNTNFQVNNYRSDTLFYEKNININLYHNYNTINAFSSMQYNNLYDIYDTFSIENDGKAIIEQHNLDNAIKMLLNIDSSYYLEKIFAVNASIQNINYFSSYNVDSLNTIYNSISIYQNLFKNIELIPTSITPLNEYTYKITDSNQYTFSTKDISYIIVDDKMYLINGEQFPTNYINYNKEIIEYRYLTLDLKENDILTIKLNKEDNLEVIISDNEILNNIYSKLKESQIKYTTYLEDYLEGTINVNENQIIFTSIPYDSKWKIYIDNKEVNPTILLNSFIGIPCDKGTHNIKLEYKQNYIIPILISLSTLINIILYIIFRKK